MLVLHISKLLVPAVQSKTNVSHQTNRFQ